MKRRWMALVVVCMLAVLSACGDLSSLSQKPTDKPKHSSVKAPKINKRLAFTTTRTIKPTAITLHWWAGWGNGNINVLIDTLNHGPASFDPRQNSYDPHPKIDHTSVQFGVLHTGAIWQLTRQPNSFARHATCGNTYSIGLELEGFGPHVDGHPQYIGKYKKQFNAVVQLVRWLMHKYKIKAVSEVDEGGKTSRGIVSHEMIDNACTWADGKHFDQGKNDVDPAYLARVLKAVKPKPKKRK